MALLTRCLDCETDVLYSNWWDRCPRCDGDLSQMRFHRRAHRNPTLIALARAARRPAPKPLPWKRPGRAELLTRRARVALRRRRGHLVRS